MSTRIKSAIATVLLLAGAAAGAQSGPEEASLASLSGDADLVFQGTVTDISYGASVEGIPHTFVTYQVEDVLKGNYTAPTLTLRFIGGVKLDGAVMRRLSVSHAPKFDKGQQDLLMVKGNAQSQCPLVRCAQGRFRFQDGMVKSEEGAVLSRGAQGDVLAVTPSEQASARDFGEGVRSIAAQANATPFDRASFVAHVRGVIAQQGARGMASAVVRSADPNEAFRGPDPAVSAPPAERSAPRRGQSASRAQSEHDRQEIEALVRNGGNPVLPAKDVEALRRLSTSTSR